MMYADLDFFLALLKDKDWLKAKAEDLYLKNHRVIWTSAITLQEIILYATREGHNAAEYIEKIVGLVKVKNAVITAETCLAVADLMGKYGFTMFDAFHALLSEGDAIISSDKIYDRLGMQRIKLEEG